MLPLVKKPPQRSETPVCCAKKFIAPREMNMWYSIENGKIQSKALEEVTKTGKEQFFGCLSADDSAKALQRLGFGEKPLQEALASRTMLFENYEDYDFMCLSFPNRRLSFSHSDKVCIYVHQNIVLFIAEKAELVEKILHQITDDEKISLAFDRLLSNFFERLITDDPAYLEKIEQEILNLENALITSKKQNCVKDIVSLRKRLMVLKRYYEQLLNVLDELQENENNTLHGNSLRYFKIFSGKVERRYHSVINLRDYVTQVREAYQAEVDIGLNNIMKLFTVITAVFLPLTLLVGWYGMNLQMPEFHWVYGYPFVIALSLLILAICFYFFKKHRWF
jgi:magnesium transporter